MQVPVAESLKLTSLNFYYISEGIPSESAHQQSFAGLSQQVPNSLLWTQTPTFKAVSYPKIKTLREVDSKKYIGEKNINHSDYGARV